MKPVALATDKPTYLPGLNGIRALAASIVLMWHSDQFASLFGLVSYGYGNTGMAGSAVTLFFVLSGFLITFLLLKEKDRFGKVDVLRFYGRRFLRIWPLYFLAVILALIVFQHLPTDKLPETNRLGAWALYFFLMPNVAYAFHLGIRSILPLWSVGVEEQFYLLWPWLFNKSQNLVRTLWAIIILVVAVKTGLRIFENGPWYQLARYTAIDSMAIGGLWAWMVYQQHRWLRWTYWKPTQVFCWLFVLISIVYKPLQVTSLYDSETHALIYACLIANVSSNSKTLLTLENRVANFLGQISYGLYVYHMPVLCVLAYVLKPHLGVVQPPDLRLGVVILLTWLTTVSIAWLSYRYFEAKFLQLKARLAKVASTNERPS